MRRPAADERSMCRNTATSIALQGFTAVLAMGAARGNLCWPPVLEGLKVGGSGPLSDVSPGCD